jgi:serine/threonine protein phosphatase 1
MFRRKPSSGGAQPTKPSVAGRAALTEAGSRVYAIGDVHGRLDLLDDLLGRVAADAQVGAHTRATLVMLGDYIDRGPDSTAVLDRLIGLELAGMGLITLAGNHEDSLLSFLDDISVGPGWLYYGGAETLASYGIKASRHEDSTATLRRLQAELRRRLPMRQFDFLRNLKLSYVDGDYVFVHAGVRPGVSLAAQRRSDMLWIRTEFLESDRDHGKVVVHGHTITNHPELRPNRIGVDTGAYASGVLSCVVLDHDQVRFLQT